MREGSIKAGVTLGERFVLTRPIGSGGAGVVWEATDAEDASRPVAVKLFRGLSIMNARGRERVHREAEVLASLDHPNIARFVAAGLDGDPGWLAMELVGGETLAEVLAERASRKVHFTPGEALAILGGICRAVAYAHGRGIVHRDLKALNVMVQEDAGLSVKVLDFGLAKLLEGGGDETTRGRRLGSIFYMSPEQALGERAGPASDVFSLATIAFEVLTLRRTWARTGEGEPLPALRPVDTQEPVNALPVVLERIATAPRPVPSAVRPELPPEVDAAILAALSIDPAARPSDPMALLATLERAFARIRAGTRALDPAAEWRAGAGTTETPMGELAGVDALPANAAWEVPGATTPDEISAVARSATARTRDGPLSGRPATAHTREAPHPGLASAETAKDEMRAVEAPEPDVHTAPGRPADQRPVTPRVYAVDEGAAHEEQDPTEYTAARTIPGRMPEMPEPTAYTAPGTSAGRALRDALLAPLPAADDRSTRTEPGVPRETVTAPGAAAAPTVTRVKPTTSSVSSISGLAPVPARNNTAVIVSLSAVLVAALTLATVLVIRMTPPAPPPAPPAAPAPAAPSIAATAIPAEAAPAPAPAPAPLEEVVEKRPTLPAKQTAGAPKPARPAAARETELAALLREARQSPGDLERVVALGQAIERAADRVKDEEARTSIKGLARKSAMVGDLKGLEAALTELERAR